MIQSLADRVGGTPLIEVDGVHVKMECTNPGGSVKDRVAVFMLSEALRRGELHAGDTVVEATSGNTGIALALAAREMGCKALVFMPEHMSEERVHMMKNAGAEVRLTPRAGSFAGACAARNEYRGMPGYYIPDQFGNPDNVRCHYERTGGELVRQLQDRGITHVDALVAGVGTGGTLMGVGSALQSYSPGVRLIAVEPEESAVMSGGPAGDHGIMGIGDGFIPELCDMSRVDQVVRVTTREAHDECRRLRSDRGWCVGVSSGANMLAARSVAARGATVVTLWADSADRYASVGLGPPEPGVSGCPMSHMCRRRRGLLAIA